MLLIKNRRAFHNYDILQNYTAGIVLTGFEVKALREKRGNLQGAFVKIKDDTPVITSFHIGRYSKLSQDISDTFLDRDRKLLLKKHEIASIKQSLEEKGKTAVPLSVILEHGLIKVEFAIVRGRKAHEKKVVAKERQIKKDLDNELKQNSRTSL
ncbi:MAG: SsrA-binding protein SmpB [Patescibacteria group bacterium]|uniref:SsrA-binding protein n=1 Tax=candidate division WWE3 bacterium TaxID=2053526 RepID=A0A955EAS8_UNCKA|nr:SsrA-binding protein SmpB [candidate division WWE3 bacterium]